ASGFDLSRPTDDQRYSMSPFPDIRLLSTQVPVGAMSPLGDVFRQPVRPVVACEDNQSVSRQARFLQSFQHSANRVIDLGYKVSVIVHACLAAKRSRWHPGSVRSRQRKIKEEG